MNAPTRNSRALRICLTLGLALLAGGCGKSVQQKAFDDALGKEQQMSEASTGAIIAEYSRVIALQPDSEWAALARARIEALEAKAKAAELHKSIFQEHGVD